MARQQAASGASKCVAASRLQIAPAPARPARQPGCRVMVARQGPRAGYWKLVGRTGEADVVHSPRLRLVLFSAASRTDAPLGVLQWLELAFSFCWYL